MRNLEFEEILSKKTGIDYEVISNLFSKFPNDEYMVVQALLEGFKLDKATLGKIWGDYMGYAFVVPLESIVKDIYVQKLGIASIMDLKSLPLYKMGKAVTVATSDPQNPYLQDKLEKKLGELVSLVFCFPFDIDSYLKHNHIIT